MDRSLGGEGRARVCFLTDVLLEGLVDLLDRDDGIGGSGSVDHVLRASDAFMRMWVLVCVWV